MQRSTSNAPDGGETDDRSAEIDRIFAAVLNGRPARWPPTLCETEMVGRACQRVAFHGIAMQLVNAGCDQLGWPGELIEAIRVEARLQALWEATHRSPLGEVLDHFAAAGVRSLVLKGTALAYSVWTSPADRRRGDTDLFISPKDVERARAILDAAGWQVGRRFVFQEVWTRNTGDGFVHVIDLHWRVRDGFTEPGAIAFEACFDRSVALPRLHPKARTTDLATTMLNCALNHASHRVYGYGGAGSKADEHIHLGGMLDTDRLARHLDDAAWQQLLFLTEQSGAVRAVTSAIELARTWFDSPVPAHVVAALGAIADKQALGPDPWNDPARAGTISSFAAKVRAAVGWRAKRDIALTGLWPAADALGIVPERSGGVRLLGARLGRLARLAVRSLGGRAR